jgi:hypothetical protein
MAPASWKGATSSRLASFKDYVAQIDYKTLSSRVRGEARETGPRQTWDQWTRQTLGKPHASSATAQRATLGVERVQLFPGWAVRRPANPSGVTDDSKNMLLLCVSHA